MALLVERLLHTTEVRGSNEVIGEIYVKHLHSTKSKRRKIKEKKAGNGPIKRLVNTFIIIKQVYLCVKGSSIGLSLEPC